MKKIIWVLPLVLLSGQLVMAQLEGLVLSNKPGWHRIGNATVDFDTQLDKMELLVDNKFAAVKYKISRAPVYLIDLELYYKDGSIERIFVGNTNQVFGESKVFHIKGGERSIKSVVVVYRTLPTKAEKKAGFELYGLKRNNNKT